MFPDRPPVLSRRGPQQRPPPGVQASARAAVLPRLPRGLPGGVLRAAALHHRACPHGSLRAACAASNQHSPCARAATGRVRGGDRGALRLVPHLHAHQHTGPHHLGEHLPRGHAGHLHHHTPRPGRAPHLPVQLGARRRATRLEVRQRGVVLNTRLNRREEEIIVQ